MCALLVSGAAAAQGLTTLEAVSARRSVDYAPVLDGKAVLVAGVVSAPPIHFAGYSQLAIQNEAGHGLTLEGLPAQFEKLRPGDHILIDLSTEYILVWTISGRTYFISASN